MGDRQRRQNAAVSQLPLSNELRPSTAHQEANVPLRAVLVHLRACANNSGSPQEPIRTRPAARDAIYRGRVFDAEIIELCVCWYITYRLSYRDFLAMMAARGVEVSQTTILHWVISYVPEFERRCHRYAPHRLIVAGRRNVCLHSR